MNSYYQKRYLEERFSFFVKVIGTSLVLLGTVALIVSIVKLFLETTFNYSILFSALFGIALIILGRRKNLKKAINLATSNRQKTKKLTLFIPIALTLIIFAVKLILDQESWKRMNTEGGFIEYGTSLAFILAFILAAYIGRSFLERKYKLFGLLYYFIAAIFIFVGLEEISWGQRLLGIKSPEFFQNYNSQEEITIHNLVWVREYLDRGLMVLGLILGISWLVAKFSNNFKDSDWFRYFIPSPFISSFFLIVFVFFFLVEYFSSWEAMINTFQEFIELLFSLGCLAFIITSFFRQSFDFAFTTESPEQMIRHQ